MKKSKINETKANESDTKNQQQTEKPQSVKRRLSKRAATFVPLCFEVMDFLSTVQDSTTDLFYAGACNQHRWSVVLMVILRHQRMLFALGFQT